MAMLVCLTGCSKYRSVVVDKYSKGITYVSYGVRWKKMYNYRFVKLKELQVTEDSVVLQHRYKCDLLYPIIPIRFYNYLETDTIVLYKRPDGKFEFHD